jgi:hypothetical protein
MATTSPLSRHQLPGGAVVHIRRLHSLGDPRHMKSSYVRSVSFFSKSRPPLEHGTTRSILDLANPLHVSKVTMGEVSVSDAEARVILLKILPRDLKMTLTTTETAEIGKIIGRQPESVK